MHLIKIIIIILTNNFNILHTYVGFNASFKQIPIVEERAVIMCCILLLLNYTLSTNSNCEGQSVMRCIIL